LRKTTFEKSIFKNISFPSKNLPDFWGRNVNFLQKNAAAPFSVSGNDAPKPIPSSRKYKAFKR